MCKYCEDKKKTSECWESSRDGRKYYIYRVGERNGGMRMIWDARHRYMLESLDKIYLSGINHCPWCGRKLAKPSVEGLPIAEEYEKMKREQENK